MRIPTTCSGVDPKVLDPINTWESKEDYRMNLHKLAKKFNENFVRYAKDTGKEVLNAGPMVQ